MADISNDNGSNKERKENPWLVHVKNYRDSHQELSYKEILQQAKESYTKVPKVEKVGDGERKPNPWMIHIDEWKSANPDWKQSMSYKDVLIKCKETYSNKTTDDGAVSL